MQNDSKKLLGKAAVIAIQEYRQQLGDELVPSDLYQMLLNAIEKPVFDYILHINNGNQSKAAAQLGMNRATLRTKLKRHGLL